MSFPEMVLPKASNGGINVRVKESSADPKEVFEGLCELLDDYAPSWYSEEKRDIALQALEILRDSGPGASGPASAD